MSLGGSAMKLKFEGIAETYVGALPGRVIQGIKKSQFEQPGLYVR